jgi:hypothetical protein
MVNNMNGVFISLLFWVFSWMFIEIVIDMYNLTNQQKMLLCFTGLTITYLLAKRNNIKL